jgi:hypothetical protein
MFHAGMTELADVQDLGSCAERRVGSTPITRTTPGQEDLAPACFRSNKSFCRAVIYIMTTGSRLDRRHPHRTTAHYCYQKIENFYISEKNDIPKDVVLLLFLRYSDNLSSCIKGNSERR